MRRASALAALALAACSATPLVSVSSSGSSSDGSTSESSGEAGDGSTGEESAGEESGGEAGASSSGEGSTGAGEQTGGESAGTGAEPPALPEIVSVKLSPEPIVMSGPIAVEVTAAHVNGVAMQIDGGAPVQLEPIAAGKFVGEIAVVSSLDNGTHAATFTPMLVEVTGEPVTQEFEAALPAGGTVIRWEVSPAVPESIGDAIAVGPGGIFYNFGTLDPGGEPRCYLWRREQSGEYMQGDLIESLLPDVRCVAKKVAVDANGELLLLAEVEQNGVKRWWLGRKTAWESPVQNLTWGTPGAVASGLAVAKDGRAAVCGAVKTVYGDRDAFVDVYDPQGGGFAETFDFVYEPDKDPSHNFSEVAHDCVFVEDELVLAGELWGQHPNDVPMDRSRHMVFEFDTKTDEVVWNIAGKGPALYVQSGARAVARDDDGGYVTAGYVCEDPCVPQMHLRQFLAGAMYIDDFMPAVKATAPTDIAFSPAGYVVVTAARLKGGWWSDFWAQAWMPGDEQELWTFARSDEMTTHMATGVAIGKYGRVYVTGTAEQAGMYRPALALLHP